MRSLVSKVFNLFGTGKTVEPAASGERRLPLHDVERDDIPRYPPFIRGFPSVPVFSLLEMQAELINEIRAALGMGHETFNEYLLPVIENVAAFVHLLPASEAHHHKGAGGLFRHALEASLYSAKASKGPVFAVDGSPKFRRDTEPLWRLACAIAGLLHDIGKPLTDMIVTNKDGSLIWSSHVHPTVHEWLTANDIDRYFLRWNANRHREHESAAHLVFNDLMPRHVRAYLSTPDTRVLKQLSDAVLIQSRIGNKIAEMMSLGDRTSVANDMRNNNLDMDQFAHGIPIERYVFDAIRRLVNTGTWKVNEQGGKVFQLHSGTFIAWKGLGDLYALLDQDKIPGIPRDPATLADIMIDGGFCEPQVIKVGEEEHRRRYWDVRPECLPTSLEMLRFNSHTYVFTTEPPAPIHGEIEEYDEDGQAAAPAQATSIIVINEQTGEILDRSDQDQQEKPEPAPKPELKPKPEPAPKPEPEPEPSAQKSEAKPKSVLDSIGVDSALSMFESKTPAPQRESEKLPSTKEGEEKAQKLASERQAQPDLSAVVRKNVSRKQKAGNGNGDGHDHEYKHEQEGASAGSKAALEELLKNYPKSSSVILSLLDPSKAALLAESGLQLVIPFPYGIQQLGEQDEVMTALRADNAINVDPVMPGVGTLRVGGQSCVVFNHEIATAIKNALAELGVQLNPLSSADEPGPASKSKRASKPAPDKAQSLPAKQKAQPRGKADKQGKKAKTKQNLMPAPPARPKPVVEAAPKAEKPVVERTNEDLASPVQNQAATSKSPDRTERIKELQIKNPSLTDVARRFKRMMLKGEGAWLAGPVVRHKGYIEVSFKSLEKITADHPQFGKNRLRVALSKHNFTLGSSGIRLPTPIDEQEN